MLPPTGTRTTQREGRDKTGTPYKTGKEGKESCWGVLIHVTIPDTIWGRCSYVGGGLGERLALSRAMGPWRCSCSCTRLWSMTARRLAWPQVSTRRCRHHRWLAVFGRAAVRIQAKVEDQFLGRTAGTKHVGVGRRQAGVPRRRRPGSNAWGGDIGLDMATSSGRKRRSLDSVEGPKSIKTVPDTFSFHSKVRDEHSTARGENLPVPTLFLLGARRVGT